MLIFKQAGLTLTLLALSCAPAHANCWAEFERPGADQFGYILLIVSRSYISGKAPRFYAVAGPTDTLRHFLVRVELPQDEVANMLKIAPTTVAVVGDVKRARGEKVLRVSRILRNKGEIQKQKAAYDKRYPGSCGSSFSSSGSNT